MGFSLLSLLGSLGSSLIGGLFSNNSTQQYVDAINKAIQNQKDEYGQSLSLLNPSINAGNTARDYMMAALGLGGNVSKSDALNAFRDSPGYQFGLKTGLNGVQTSAAANGSLFSGGTLKDLNNFGQGYADQQYGNWLGNLSGLASGGTGAAGSAVNASTNEGNNISNLLTGQGAVQAQGNANTSGAITGGLSDILKYINQLGGGSTGTSSYSNGNNNAGILGTLY
jgi:hypothetical protein